MPGAVLDICAYQFAMYCQDRDAHSEERVWPDGIKRRVDILKLLCMSEMHDFQLQSVEVRDSSVHGRGVFATKHIAKGEVATFYPGDHVFYTPDRALVCNGKVLKLAIHSQRAAVSPAPPDKTYYYDVDDNYTLQGCPSHTGDPSYLGHMVNDGARPTLDPASHGVYVACTMAKSNCRYAVLSELSVAVIATRDILPEEELFVPYGLPYWESMLGSDS